MSELRDVAGALRALSERMTSNEDCLLIVLRNSEQQADWRHEQRGIEQRRMLQEAEQKRSLEQVQEFQGALWKYLGRLDERLELLSQSRHDDARTLSERVRKLEPEEEITKP